MQALDWKKKFLFYSILFAGICLVIELGFRIVFAFEVGPSVLLYGTKFHWKKVDARYKNHNVAFHGHTLDNYSKYFPNQSRVTHDKKTGEIIPVRINSRGFRGRDFLKKKDDTTIRVVTLGASSTFGYYNRDDETYPYYIEQFLNEAYRKDKSYEVINLGIPHQKSSQILSLFLSEALPLTPDVVTFYEGNNDVGAAKNQILLQARRSSFLQRAVNLAAQKSLVFFFIFSLSNSQFEGFTKEHLDKYGKAVSDQFLKSLALIHKECESRGIVFIVATQQKTSKNEQSGILANVTYTEEVEQAKRKLSTEGTITGWEFSFLLHSILMKDLPQWASDNKVPFVDVIKAMDHRRDTLLSAVHVSPQGNRLIARAFADEIGKCIWPAKESEQVVKRRY